MVGYFVALKRSRWTVGGQLQLLFGATAGGSGGDRVGDAVVSERQHNREQLRGARVLVGVRDEDPVEVRGANGQVCGIRVDESRSPALSPAG